MHEYQPETTGATNPALWLEFITGTSSALLAEYARDASDADDEPVVQYVLTIAENEALVYRRECLAGQAPTISAVAIDPSCLGCAIGTDIVEYAVGLTPGFTRMHVVLPPGVDARHLARKACGHPLLCVSRIQVVLDHEALADEVRCNDDLDLSEMVCWHDDERWVAHAVIGLITAADTIVLSDSESAPAATNLLNHLNPCAQVRSSAPPTASAHPSSPGDLDAQSDWRPQMWTTPATGPVQSSVFESSQPLNREKLIQILADISQEVLRVEGVVYLSDQPDTPFHLHVSAGLAALDARDHWAQEGAKTTNLIVTTQPESGNRHGLVLQSLRSAEQAPHRHR